MILVVKIESFIKVILIATMFLMLFMPISNAGFWDDIISQGDTFISNGETVANADKDTVDETEFKDLIKKLYNILLALGVALSVIIGAILGIKFMMGSVEEQAKIKEMIMPYVMGCVVVFGAFGIWKLVIELAGTLQ